ncbi:MAG TPA: amino acid-binding protein, partial [Spirillospora sp.]
AWPVGSRTDRLAEGLRSVPGVDVVGMWPTTEPQGAHPDAAVIGQIAAVPERGMEILADAVPAVLSADWAGVAEVGGDGEAVLVHASPGSEVTALPDLLPLRPRAFTAGDGAQYAVCPLARGTLALLVARSGAPPFHWTEVFRLEQLAAAADAVLRSDTAGRPVA